MSESPLFGADVALHKVNKQAGGYPETHGPLRFQSGLSIRVLLLRMVPYPSHASCEVLVQGHSVGL